VLGEGLGNFAQVSLGEHEANVFNDIGQQVGEVRVGLHLTSDALLHHGVLAHQDLGLAAQRDADLLHLVGADVVGADNEALGVLIDQALHLGEELGLPYFTIFLNHLGSVLGMTWNSLLKLSKF